MERIFIKKRKLNRMKNLKKNKLGNRENQNELSLDTPEAVSSPKTAGLLNPTNNWEIIRQYRDANGNVDIEKAKEAIPTLNKSLTHTLRDRQTKIVESINMNDIQGAGLRDKAMSSKALHDQATELEQGKPMGNIQVFYIKAK